MIRKLLTTGFGTLLLSAGLSAQISVPATQSATIEAGGLNGTDIFYAQFAGSNFDEYSLAEFDISSADFGGQNVLDITSLSLRVTVNDRFFSAAGTFSILFTTDSVADLTTATNYDALAFDSNETYGINTSTFTDTPIVVGTGTYDETVVAGGDSLDVAIDLTNIEADLLSAISAGDSVHFLIGVESASGTVATFSGTGNTYDPGDPTLIFEVTTDGPAAEPSAYPTDFAASSNLRDINLAWTDAPDTAGYLLLISETNSFTAPTDGVALAEDLDLADGSGSIVVAQGSEAATFSGLDENTQYFFTIYPYSNSGAQTDYKTDGTPPTTDATTTEVPVGDIIITQYYEGSFGNNKYIELSNVTSSAVDMNDFILTAWSNATTEDWKLSGNTTSRSTVFTGIVLPAGGSIIVADPRAATPIASGDADVSNGQATFFNGNDTVVLYATSAQDPTNIIDVIPFTDAGNEGANVNFVRLTTAQGYDFVAGTSVLDFPAVWQQVDNTVADAAVFGDDAFLGTSDLVTPPPQVFFTDTSILVSETGVSVDLTIEIQNPDGNSIDVDVVYDDVNSTAALADIGSYTTQTVSFGAGASGGDQQTVTITLTNDSDLEVTENALFDLSNLVSTGNAVVGSASTATLSIQDDDTPVPNVFISEIVDPQDNAGEGRYVELFNPTGSPIDLAAGNWNLVIYFNANTSGTDIPLNGTIPAGGTYIIAESDTFDAVYSVTDEDDVGNLNSNGDDNFELRFGGDQSTGVLVDVYGSPGTQGAGEAWEFTDSRAVRLSTVTEGAISWESTEWAIVPATVADASPREHPETIILAPSDVSATAQSDTVIDIAFTPIDGNDVVLVFNTTGTFTAPSGTPPAAGQPFADGTILYQGQSSPYSHTGLTAETQYFYALFSVSGTDYSNTVQVEATTDAAPLVGVINEEDFDDTPGDADDWFNATVIGDDPWDFGQSDAFIDGLTTDNDAVEEHYLVSPAFDFRSETALTLTFDYVGGFDVESLESLELVYSTNYSGSGDPEAGGTTWTAISFAFTNVIADGVTSSAFASSGAIALPAAIEGEGTVYLAFRYNSDGTLNSEQWLIDNIVLQGGGSSDPFGDYLTLRGLSSGDLYTDVNDNGFTVLEEYLSGFGDSSGSDTIIYGVDLDGKVALTLVSDRDDEPEDITISLLATSDLGVAFTPVSFDYSVIENLDGTFTHTYEETTPPVVDQRFLRLQILED